MSEDVTKEKTVIDGSLDNHTHNDKITDSHHHHHHHHHHHSEGSTGNDVNKEHSVNKHHSDVDKELSFDKHHSIDAKKSKTKHSSSSHHKSDSSSSHHHHHHHHENSKRDVQHSARNHYHKKNKSEKNQPLAVRIKKALYSDKADRNNFSLKKKISKINAKKKNVKRSEYTLVSRRVLFVCVLLCIFSILTFNISKEDKESKEIASARQTSSETQQLRSQITKLQTQLDAATTELDKYKAIYGELDEQDSEKDEKQNSNNTNK